MPCYVRGLQFSKKVKETKSLIEKMEVINQCLNTDDETLREKRLRNLVFLNFRPQNDLTYVEINADIEDVIVFLKKKVTQINIVINSRNGIQGSRYLVIDFCHPWLKSTRQRAKLRAATVLRPLTFALNEQSVCLPQ